MTDFGTLVVEPDASGVNDCIVIAKPGEGYMAEIRREEGLQPADWELAHLFAAAPQMRAALKAVHEPYRHLTEEALEAGILMEFGPPKPEKGASLLLVRAAIAKAETVAIPSTDDINDTRPDYFDWSGPEEGDKVDLSVWITNDYGNELYQVESAEDGGDTELNKEIARRLVARLNPLTPRPADHEVAAVCARLVPEIENEIRRD